MARVYGYALALMVALCLVSSIARAEPRRADPAQLTYTRGKGAGSCPDVEALRDAVVKEMGYDPFRPDAPQKLDVTIERRAGELSVAMSLRAEDGGILWETNSMRSRGDCGSLVKAVGLSIAIHLDPIESAPCPVCPAPPAPAVPPPAPRPVVSPPVEEVPPSKPADAAGDAAPHRPQVFVGAGALLALQAPFAISPAGTLFVGVRWPHVSIAVEGKGSLSNTVGIVSPRVNISSATAGAALSAHVGMLFGCGAVGAGAIVVNERSGIAPFQPLKPFAAVNAALRAGVEVPIAGHLALRGYAEIVGALTPDPASASVMTQLEKSRPVERNLGFTGLAAVLRF
jgi:hypothetical protein